ncbi:MAG: response regulator [Solirubrobacteraceae bacterium]|nr:response regulator [Solirubrobacteraceae bacterium]
MSTPSSAAPRTTPRVAFVDDEPALTALAGRAMALYGCDAITFSDPRDALLAITADPTGFDALITDHTMPGLSGVELALHVRDIRPGLPIVLTSGFLTPDNRRSAEVAGVDTIVPKPCSMEDLATAALALLADGGRGSTAPA